MPFRLEWILNRDRPRFVRNGADDAQVAACVDKQRPERRQAKSDLVNRPTLRNASEVDRQTGGQ